MPCGLATCRQGHLHGFLVRTASGEETNIGHVCGTRYFGDEFSIASAAYRRAKERHEIKSRVCALKILCAEVQGNVENLMDKPFGARWVENLKKRLQKRIGNEAFMHLTARARAENYDVIKTIERSEEEIAKIVHDTGKKRDQVKYVDHFLGRLPPLNWLSFDFRAEIIDGVRIPFEIIFSADLDEDVKTLQGKSKKCAGWEEKIKNVEKNIAEAKKIFSSDAIKIFQAALEEFFVNKKAPPGDWSLLTWEQSIEGRALIKGEPKLPEVTASLKSISKGKQKKRRRN